MYDLPDVMRKALPFSEAASAKDLLQELSRARRPPSEGGPPIPSLEALLPPSHSLLAFGGSSQAAGGLASPGSTPQPATPYGQVNCRHLLFCCLQLLQEAEAVIFCAGKW